MIKELFFPEKIGNYILFSKQIIGLEVTKFAIYGTKVKFRGKALIVERFVHERIDQNDQLEPHLLIAEAIQRCVLSLGKYDQINIVFPSTYVIYKELQLPFLSREKIHKIVPFEIEPLIPFSIQKAVIDFIITSQYKEVKSSHLLIAVVQKIHVEQFLNQYQQGGVSASQTLVDFFALYGLYMQTSLATQLKGRVVLLDIGYHVTRMMFIDHGQARMVRTLSQGIFSIAKTVSAQQGIKPYEFLELFMRFGIDQIESTYKSTVDQAMRSYAHLIRLTLDSFLRNEDDSEGISQVVLLGEAALMEGINDYLSRELNIPFTILDSIVLETVPHISFANKTYIPASGMMSLSSCILSEQTKECTLQQQEYATDKTASFSKQIMVLFFLSIVLVGSLFTRYWITTNTFQSDIEQATKETVIALKKQFPKIPKEEDLLDEVVALAKQEVERERETWALFSLASQSRFLLYLLELTTKIDKESLECIVERITITEGIMILKAQVKNYEALKILEKELRQSSLFSYVEPQDNPKFSMKIILAPVAKE